MNKTLLSELVEQKLSTREISKEINKSQSVVMYWLRKHNLTTKIDITYKRTCARCKQNKLRSEFYKKRGKEGASSYCKGCTRIRGTERARAFKVKCVEYKGGKCEKCGYDKYIGALEFHHLDPTQKDFGIAKVPSRTFNDKVKAELDKCTIVCSNCHKEIHGNIG